MTDVIKKFNCSRFGYKHIVYGLALILAILIFNTSSAFAIDEEFVEYCSREVFDEKYEGADCWSCDVVKVFMKSLSSLSEVLYNTIMEICHIILSLGAAIWLAVYLLKSVGSLATQDPAKIIDGAVMFFFKWALIYTLLTFGMDALIENIVNPLLSIGWDIGSEFTKGAGIG